MSSFSPRSACAYSDEEAAALKAEAEEAAGIAPEAEPEPEEGGE